MVDDLYRLSWDDAFAQFVQSIEEYVEIELPADVSPAERKLQDDMRRHLEEYKAATRREEIRYVGASKKADRS